MVFVGFNFFQMMKTNLTTWIIMTFQMVLLMRLYIFIAVNIVICSVKNLKY